MRIHRRFLETCAVAALIAAGSVAAFAQGGRGGAAAQTNDFFRFNYTGDRMDPIAYPPKPITTQHSITLHGETIDYTAHVGFHTDPQRHQRRCRGAPFLRLLFEK